MEEGNVEVGTDEVAPVVDTPASGSVPEDKTGDVISGKEGEGIIVDPWKVDGGILKVKGDGKEHEFKSLEELRKVAELGLGARRAMRETEDLRKAQKEWETEKQTIAQQLEAFVSQVKENPDAFFTGVGMTNEQKIAWAEKQLRGHLDFQALTPEQKAEKARYEKLEQERAELMGYKTQREKDDAEKAKQAADVQRQEENARDKAEFEAAIDKEVEGDSVLGVETMRPYVKTRAAQIIMEAHAAGLYLPIDKAVGYVRAERVASLRDHFKAMTPEQQIEFLGEDWARGIREYDVGRVKAVQKASTAVKNTGSGDKKFGSMSDYLRTRNGG